MFLRQDHVGRAQVVVAVGGAEDFPGIGNWDR